MITWHPLVMYMFIMMPTATHCSALMMAHLRSLEIMTSAMCSTWMIAMILSSSTDWRQRMATKPTVYLPLFLFRLSLLHIQPPAALSQPTTTTPQVTVQTHSGRQIKAHVLYLQAIADSCHNVPHWGLGGKGGGAFVMYIQKDTINIIMCLSIFSIVKYQ